MLAINILSGVSSEHYLATWYTEYNIFEDEINFYA